MSFFFESFRGIFELFDFFVYMLFLQKSYYSFFFFRDKIQMGLTLTSGMQRNCQRNYCESGIRSSPRDDLPGRRQHQHTRWLWGQSREVVSCVLNSTVRALWLSPLKEATFGSGCAYCCAVITRVLLTGCSLIFVLCQASGGGSNGFSCR